MSENSEGSGRDRWARLRFSIVGPLLASPASPGELRSELVRLSEKPWRHPITGSPIHFGVSTIERWFYAALRERRDPVAALRRRLRKDAGVHRRLSHKLRLALRTQYEEHKSWSYQLHADNLIALAQSDSALGEVPSYSTLRRYLKAQGMFKQRRRRSVRSTAGAAERWEVRSFEAEYVCGLWHLDFHHGSRKITTREGERITPMLLGVLDDRSRLACHLQWYLDETAEALVHGLSQAIRDGRAPRSPCTQRSGPRPGRTGPSRILGASRLGRLEPLSQTQG